MSVLTRVREAFWRPPAAVQSTPAEPDFLADLEIRRAESTVRVFEARQAEQVQEALVMAGGISIDADDHLFRRVSSGKKLATRDLSPMQQDRMIEIAWYLYEGNPFAKRLPTLMTDLIVGEGVNVKADDPRVLEILQQTWHHPINRFGSTIRELYISLMVNGELVLPVERNPISGIPCCGYIDPYQIKEVRTKADNVRIPDVIELKPDTGAGKGLELKIIQENPSTGMLEGECFYFAINRLSNSRRGRSDFLAVADWLDLFDQLLFAEVERVQMLGSFVYDLSVKGGDEKKIRERLRAIGTPKPGSMYGHNENETLTAISPNLQAAERSEIARLLTIHIAGNMGFPLAWFGHQDSANATIQGQNDVMMKTPSARQKELKGFLDLILRYAVEGAMQKNPVLFRGTKPGFGVSMPEISAKDIARVGGVLSAVMSAVDTGQQNRTLSRRAAAQIVVETVRHVGVDLGSAEDLIQQIDEEEDETRSQGDEFAAAVARRRSLNPNAPITRTGDADTPVIGEDSADKNVALNGAQVKSMLDIINQVALGQLPRETGVAAMVAAFSLSADLADEIMGTVGRGFVPRELEQVGA